MKYLSHLYAVLYSTLIVSCTVSAGECIIKTRAFYFPPMTMQDEQGKWIGMDIDQTKVLLDRVNCQTKILVVPWARSLRMLEYGDIDMMLDVTKTPAREKIFHFVGPHRNEAIRLVSKKGLLAPITSWSQLDQLQLTLMRQRGSVFGPRFIQMLATNNYIRTNMIELADNEVRLDLIQKGRIQGFFVDSAYINYVMKTDQNYKILEVHPLIIHTNPIYYAFSKASVSEERMVKIRQAFAQLQQTNALQAIVERYENK